MGEAPDLRPSRSGPRDAAVRWHPYSEKPAKPMPVIFWLPDSFSDEPDPLPVYRIVAERCELGFWDGETFAECGTGHDMREYEWFEMPHRVPLAWAELDIEAALADLLDRSEPASHPKGEGAEE
jgi:hypothetical protein